MPQVVPSDGYLDDYVPDCPVQVPVWRRYQDMGPRASETLIVQVRSGESPPVVAGKLRDWFEDKELVIHGSYILVDAAFEEVLTRLLPLTDWRRFVLRLAAVERARLLIEVGAVRERLPVSVPATGGVEWGAENRARLRWLIEMVARVYDGAGERLDDGKATTRLRRLLREAAEAAESEVAPISSVGVNRQVRPAVHESRMTVKVDAAERVFDIDCSGITWAVVDTGIDKTHPAFASGKDERSRVGWTFDVEAGLEALKKEQRDTRFVGLLDDSSWTIFMEGALVAGKAAETGRSVDDRTEHGTHVAGILGANYEPPPERRPSKKGQGEKDRPHKGICPTIRLVDIRVFDSDVSATEFTVILGLAFVRWLNDRQRLGPKDLIDGVNISLSVPFAVESHACGWTPVCQECDRLVKSGVVVVASAGNAGFAEGAQETIGGGFALVSISDPGNAEAVITVGATDSKQPHRFGPTARSARGPTADGRHKPDLLAPGFRILGPAPGGDWQQLSGTSMAAPHVSGVAAMLLARFPELRGQPDRVKDILCRTATDLGRLRDFQGHGLLNALGALQAQ